MKSADKVLANRQVNSRLSAYRRIDLRKQRGWRLDDGNTAQVDSGGETGEVANDASAERQYQVVSFEAVFAKKLDGFFKDRERLVTFALGHQPLKGLEAFSLETSHHLATVEVENSLIRDDSDPARSFGQVSRDQLTQLPPDTAADIDFTLASFAIY